MDGKSKDFEGDLSVMERPGDGELAAGVIAALPDRKTIRRQAKEQRKQRGLLHKALENLNADELPVQYKVIEDGKKKIGILTTPIITEASSGGYLVNYYGISDAGFVTIQFHREHIDNDTIATLTDPLHRGTLYFPEDKLLTFHSILRIETKYNEFYIGDTSSEQFSFDAWVDTDGGRTIEFFDVKRESAQSACDAFIAIQETIVSAIANEGAALTYGVTNITDGNKKKKR